MVMWLHDATPFLILHHLPVNHVMIIAWRHTSIAICNLLDEEYNASTYQC